MGWKSVDKTWKYLPPISSLSQIFITVLWLWIEGHMPDALNLKLPQKYFGAGIFFLRSRGIFIFLIWQPTRKRRRAYYLIQTKSLWWVWKFQTCVQIFLRVGFQLTRVARRSVHFTLFYRIPVNKALPHISPHNRKKEFKK